MTIREFKNEFRLVCTDTWGDALDAWFECAGRMHKRGLPIPDNWKYFPGISGDGTEKDCYWHTLFARCGNKQLTNIGNFLFRYCQFLKYKNVDY